MLAFVGRQVMRLLLKRQLIVAEDVWYTSSASQVPIVCLRLEGLQRLRHWTIIVQLPTCALDHLNPPHNPLLAHQWSELYLPGILHTASEVQITFLR